MVLSSTSAMKERSCCVNSKYFTAYGSKMISFLSKNEEQSVYTYPYLLVWKFTWWSFATSDVDAFLKTIPRQQWYNPSVETLSALSGLLLEEESFCKFQWVLSRKDDLFSRRWLRTFLCIMKLASIFRIRQQLKKSSVLPIDMHVLRWSSHMESKQ